MKKIILLVVAIMVVCAIQAQSIVGSWKCISNVLVNADGSKQDLWKTIVKSFACAADMKYVFDANGRHYVKAAKDCEAIAAISNAAWSVSGSTITLTTQLPTVTTTTYTLSFVNGSAVLTHIYTPGEKASLKITTNRITITYQKV